MSGEPSARVVWQSPSNDTASVELIGTNGTMHRIETGGDVGSGYCYEHQTFDCFEKLDEAELRALSEA